MLHTKVARYEFQFQSVMFRFAACAQEDASDAFDYTNACYPCDGNERPISNRLSKLIRWGSRDLERFDRICDFILNRIRHDIRAQQYDSISVSLQILAELLATVPYLNLSISRVLTDAILLLIRTSHTELIGLAMDMLDPLARHSDRLALKRSVQRIVTASLSLCSDDHLMNVGFQALSLLIAKVSIDWLPLAEILAAVQPELSNGSNAHLVIFTIAESASPITIPLLCDSIVLHLDNINAWRDTICAQELITALFSRMKNDLKGAFLRLWLENVVSGPEDILRDCGILSVAVNLLTEFTNIPRYCRNDLIGIVEGLALDLPRTLPQRTLIVQRSADLKCSRGRNRTHSNPVPTTHGLLGQALIETACGSQNAD
jgi:hypothetical protein